jgi:hypothetical protein
VKDKLWNWGRRQVQVCELDCRRDVGLDSAEFRCVWTHCAGVGRHLLVYDSEAGLDPLKRDSGHLVQMVIIFAADHVNGQCLMLFSPTSFTAIDNVFACSMMSPMLTSTTMGVVVGVPGFTGEVVMPVMDIAAVCAMVRVQSSNAMKVSGLPISNRVDGRSLL